MLRLRPYKPCDASQIVSWIPDELVFYQWSAGRMGEYPLTKERFNEHYRQFDDSGDFWAMTACSEAMQPVGHFIMRFPDEQRQVLRLGFIIVDGKLRGKGVGKEMIKLAVSYAFDYVGAKKVTLGVFANNPGARYCYEAAGFCRRGSETYAICGEAWECVEMEYVPEAKRP